MDEFIFQMEVISIHAPPRGATFSICPSIHVSVFQFTPLREGRRNRCRTLFRVSEFQFTPLREGRHSRRVLTDRRRISIHAPPRGATGSSCTGRKLSGAISIHAPPRGATYSRNVRVESPFDFNSRPSARGDMAGVKFEAHYQVFQFTPLREGRRRGFLRQGLADGDFNSRPSARGDVWVRRSGSRAAVFQFTPLREGRQASLAGQQIASISIHAPPRGATSASATDTCSSFGFQFTPLREGRPDVQQEAAKPTAFQFTPLREGRRAWCGLQNQQIRISIHAPPRGATASSIVRGQASYFNSRPSARGDSLPSSFIHQRIFQFTPLREGRRKRQET